MDQLRTSFLAAFVSLLILTGYASNVLDFCCESEKQEQATHGAGSPGQSAPNGEDGCHCICHQVFTASAVDPAQMTPQVLAPGKLHPLRDEFPPDAVPFGIDYPPQLA